MREIVSSEQNNKIKHFKASKNMILLIIVEVIK